MRLPSPRSDAHALLGQSLPLLELHQAFSEIATAVCSQAGFEVDMGGCRRIRRSSGGGLCDRLWSNSGEVFGRGFV